MPWLERAPQGAGGGAAPVLAPSVGRMLSQGAAEAGAVCPVCGKAFKGDKYKFRLSRHMIIHTGQKPFACPHCPYRAARRDHVSRHVRMVHTPRLHALAAAATLATLPHLQEDSTPQPQSHPEDLHQDEARQHRLQEEVQQHNE
ncbi:zinc finger protein 467-like [Penaeus indicus]|uniref:zinc finger protein 467-like n=1 Tax=Penaeus indicus TaxID=29960 RepID=UPI00300CD80C